MRSIADLLRNRLLVHNVCSLGAHLRGEHERSHLLGGSDRGGNDHSFFFRTALKEFRRWARARFAMNVDQSSPVIVGNNRLRYVQWGPVITGALLAGALAFVLNTIAVAIGLGVSSTAPT